MAPRVSEAMTTLEEQARTRVWEYLLSAPPERSLAWFGLNLSDIKRVNITCRAANAAVKQDPCWTEDVFGRSEEQVKEWPLFSPAELYDLDAGTVIWAWIKNYWYRGTLYSDPDLKVAFDDGDCEPWDRVVKTCLKKQRLRVEKWVCQQKLTPDEKASLAALRDGILQKYSAKCTAVGRQHEDALRLQEDLALLLSRMGRAEESQPLWKELLAARIEFAPSRAAAAKGSDKRNAQVWYTFCARRGAVGGWDGAYMGVPFHCCSNNSIDGAAYGYCDVPKGTA